MVVANLLDLSADDLHHLGADAFNDLTGALSYAMEIRLGHGRKRLKGTGAVLDRENRA